MSDNEIEEDEENNFEDEENLDEEIDEELEEGEEGNEEDEEDLEDLENKIIISKKSKLLEKITKPDSNHLTYIKIPKNERKTSHILHHTEYVEAIGIRITQIEQGAPVFTDVVGLNNASDIARKEFFDRQSPLKLTREVKREGNNVYIEKWKVREMTFPVLEKELSLTTKQMDQLLLL